MSSNSSSDLPSTLTGPPVSALCPPGECQFGEELVAVPLLKRTAVSETSSVLRFGLPDASKPLGLSTCACILAQADIDGESVVRPYTPISTNQNVGSFDLLVKNYGPSGKMSRFLHEIDEGSTAISFKHIPFNVKIQAPFKDTDHILMLVGGTGITPMIQALHDILGGSGNGKPKVTMMYGSRVSRDILGKDLLDAWSASHGDQFNVVHVLSHEPADSAWSGLRGFITKDLIAEHFPAASEPNLRVFICGPPPMYQVFSGPRTEADKVTGILGDMGYTPEQVYKF